MSNVVEEIREALTPHPVEGFTAICFPTPTLEQVQRLIAEVERLTISLEETVRQAAERERRRTVQLRRAEFAEAERDRYKAALEYTCTECAGNCPDCGVTKILAAEAVRS